MENLTLIQSERIDFILKEILELKSHVLNLGNSESIKKWLPKSEARQHLNVCQKTLDNYLHNGTLPYSRFAGKIYIKASDIQAHLENHYIKS